MLKLKKLTMLLSPHKASKSKIMYSETSLDIEQTLLLAFVVIGVECCLLSMEVYVGKDISGRFDTNTTVSGQYSKIKATTLFRTGLLHKVGTHNTTCL